MATVFETAALEAIMASTPAGAHAPDFCAPAADQSTVKHLRLTVLSVSTIPHGLRLRVRCGDVGFAVDAPGAPSIHPGDALVMEYRKGDNPLIDPPTAIYPADQKPSKEQTVNTIAIASSTAVTMTSREIAELTNKEHFHVMRDARKLKEDLGDMFGGSLQNWIHPQNGQAYEEFVLDKETTLTLLLGYDAVARMKVVKRWQELEAGAAQGFTIPQTMGEALRLAADLAEQRDQLALENKAQAAALADAQPKVAGFDLITAGEKSITIREAAKLLGIKENRLTSWLHEHGWTYRLNGRWVAKQEHIQGGRLIYKEAKYTDEKTGHEVYAPYCHITPKGIAKLARVFGSDQEQLAA